MIKSIFWYSSLTIIGIIMTSITLYIKRKRGCSIVALIIFYLFATIIGYIGEFLILAVFSAYSYKLGVSKNIFADYAVVHLAVNGTLWTGTAIWVSAFSLRYYWIFLISIVYMLIEELFLKLGIYEHNWWRTYMTGIAIFTYLTLMKMWYNKLKLRSTTLWYITFYLIGALLASNPIVLLLLFGKQYYTIGWVQDLYRDSALFSVLYHEVMSTFFFIFVCILKKWYWRLMPIPIFLLGDVILIHMNILIFQNGWNLFHLTLIHIMSLILFILLQKYGWKVPLK